MPRQAIDSESDLPEAPACDDLMVRLHGSEHLSGPAQATALRRALSVRYSVPVDDVDGTDGGLVRGFNALLDAARASGCRLDVEVEDPTVIDGKSYGNLEFRLVKASPVHVESDLPRPPSAGPLRVFVYGGHALGPVLDDLALALSAFYGVAVRGQTAASGAAGLRDIPGIVSGLRESHMILETHGLEPHYEPLVVPANPPAVRDGPGVQNGFRITFSLRALRPRETA